MMRMFVKLHMYNGLVHGGFVHTIDYDMSEDKIRLLFIDDAIKGIFDRDKIEKIEVEFRQYR